MSMQVNIYDTVEELIESLAVFFVKIANRNKLQGKRFSVALSGGNSPKKLYALLASDAFKSQLDWKNIDFFFGDERYVPHTDPASNFKMADEVLFQPLAISKSQVFPMDTSLEPDAAAAAYGDVLNKYFRNTDPQFDLVLLGLGDNSHTASLFPSTPVLHETEATAKAVYLQDQQVYRITLTAPLINIAHNICFLVYGKDKAEAVHRVQKGQHDIETYPAQLIRPVNGELIWFLDKDAASAL